MDISPEAFKQGLLGQGLPGHYADFMVAFYGQVKAGQSATVTGEVARILNRRAISFDPYASGYASCFK